MPSTVIPTERLDLILQTPDEVLALVEAMPPEDRAKVSPDWLGRIRATPAGNPWALNFSVVKRGGAAGIRVGASKGPPDPDGVVELAYGIERRYRHRVYATESGPWPRSRCRRAGGDRQGPHPSRTTGRRDACS